MKNLSPSLALLVACIGRILVYGASIGDSIAVIGVSALYGYTLYLNTKTKADVPAEIKQELGELKSAVNALKLGKSIGRF